MPEMSGHVGDKWRVDIAETKGRVSENGFG